MDFPNFLVTVPLMVFYFLAWVHFCQVLLMSIVHSSSRNISKWIWNLCRCLSRSWRTSDCKTHFLQIILPNTQQCMVLIPSDSTRANQVQQGQCVKLCIRKVLSENTQQPAWDYQCYRSLECITSEVCYKEHDYTEERGSCSPACFYFIGKQQESAKPCWCKVQKQ